MIEHVWFKDFDWDALLEKKLKAPFVPPPGVDHFDAKYTNSEWKDSDTEAMRQNSVLLRRNSVQALFNGYYHDDALAAMNSSNAKGIINLNNGEAKELNDTISGSTTSIKDPTSVGPSTVQHSSVRGNSIHESAKDSVSKESYAKVE